MRKLKITELNRISAVSSTHLYPKNLLVNILLNQFSYYLYYTQKISFKSTCLLYTSFLKNRLSGSIDIYHRETSDLHSTYEVPTPP